MRRVVIVAPDLSTDLEGESVLRGLPCLAELAERSTVTKLSPIGRVPAPEALALGFRPPEGQMAAGPLTVAALGFDPPARSLHFHLSLGSLEGDTLVEGAPEPSDDEIRVIAQQIVRLNTKTLTVLPGMGCEHGLVWEELGDLGTTPYLEAVGKPMRSVLPESDGETKLRRLIEDSVDLLDSLEFNQRRVSEGIAPLNLLWPWGHGQRRPVANLALRRGEPGHVETSSLRMRGLARLAGYSASPVSSILETSIVWWEAPGQLRRSGDLEKLDWTVRTWERERLLPLLEDPIQLVLATPRGDGPGLALAFDSTRTTVGRFPFDERTLDEKTATTFDLADLVDRTLAPVG